MNENADTFVFYPTILEQIAQTKNKDIQNALFFAVARYGCYGEIPDFSDIDKFGILDAAFLPMKILIDKAKENRKLKSRCGKTGGGQVGNQNAAKTEKRAETSKNEQNELNVNVNVYGDENINKDRESRKKSGNRFSPPSLEEIKSYIEEKGYKVDGDNFYNFYESNGWMIGKNKMKNWHAAVATWEKRGDYAPAKPAIADKYKERRGEREFSSRCAADYNVSF